MLAGKILIALSLHGKDHEIYSNNSALYAHPTVGNGNTEEWEGIPILSQATTHSKAPSHHKILEGKHMMKSITGRLEKLFHKNEDSATTEDSSEISTSLSDYEDCVEQPLTTCNFDESTELMQSVSNEQEMPENLRGGVLVDQTYVVPSKDLNKFLFDPNSQFRSDLADLQGLTDVWQGPWMCKSGGKSHLTRVVSYTNPASKLVKAVKATEEQTYIKANGREFAVSVIVSTPDAPYGSAFKIELLYKIMPGPTTSTEEETTHLIISWAINFHQNTMMKGMIEGGARQGLKDSFDQFAGLLSQNFRTPNSEGILDKDQVLENLHGVHQSDWELATEYFWNFTVFSTIVMILYVVLHILLCGPRTLQGLEFYGLELPDSFGELITTGILILQLERVYEMVSHFIQARLQRGEKLHMTQSIYSFTMCKKVHTLLIIILTGSDHGVKAQGDGWVLTVALIDGTSLASLDSSDPPDPYVVLTCNGKTRTSSVKLQTFDPQWNGKSFIQLMYIYCHLVFGNHVF